MRFFARVLVLSVVMANLGYAQEPASSSAGVFNGHWTVTDIVGYSDTSGGIPQAKELLGQQVIISDNEIDIGENHCRTQRGFRVSEVATAPTLQEYYGISPTDAGLPTRTSLLDSAECTPVFRLGEHRIVLGWNGVVVRAIKNAVKPR